MLDILPKLLDSEKNIPALAITDPQVHSKIAMMVLGLVTPSLICGANAIATMAAMGVMLYANNSDHTVGISRWSRR